MPDLPLASQTVGALVAADYRRAAALKRFGIDFCCGGGLPLADACARRGVDVDAVVAAVKAESAHAPDAALPRMDTWPPALLADYIVHAHHGYVREHVPALRAFTQKVARVHGGERPALHAIAETFDALATELEAHLAAEETEVFPLIRAVADGTADADALARLVGAMEDDHDAAGAALREIRRLSDDYTPPDGACATYRAAFVGLEAFEDDLHRHVHLENNVLFPRALAIAGAAVES